MNQARKVPQADTAALAQMCDITTLEEAQDRLAFARADLEDAKEAEGRDSAFILRAAKQTVRDLEAICEMFAAEAL